MSTKVGSLLESTIPHCKHMKLETSLYLENVGLDVKLMYLCTVYVCWSISNSRPWNRDLGFLSHVLSTQTHTRNSNARHLSDGQALLGLQKSRLWFSDLYDLCHLFIYYNLMSSIHQLVGQAAWLAGQERPKSHYSSRNPNDLNHRLDSRRDLTHHSCIVLSSALDACWPHPQRCKYQDRRSCW